MKVLVEADTDDLLEDLSTDSRGRVTLGSDYAGEESVTVAVIRDE